MLCKDTGIHCLLQSPERGESTNTGHVCCCCFLCWHATYLLALDFLMTCAHTASQLVPEGKNIFSLLKLHAPFSSLRFPYRLLQPAAEIQCDQLPQGFW